MIQCCVFIVYFQILRADTLNYMKEVLNVTLHKQVSLQGCSPISEPFLLPHKIGLLYQP